MARRRFDHLFVELSAAVGVTIPRYRLWLQLHEQGWNPEALSCPAAVAFCEGPLRPFLEELGLSIRPRALRRLRRAISRFDPDAPLPLDELAPE